MNLLLLFFLYIFVCNIFAVFVNLLKMAPREIDVSKVGLLNLDEVLT